MVTAQEAIVLSCVGGRYQVFRDGATLVATIDLPEARYREPHQQRQFVQRLIEGLGSLRDVRRAAISAGLPFSHVSDAGIRIDGRLIGTPESGAPANYYRVTPLYFQAMGIPLLRGRLFTEHDTATAQPVAIINETMAKRFFANEDPIGARLDISGPTYLREIVGVVGDVKQAGLKASTPSQVYEPFFQKPSNSFNAVVRVLGKPMHLAEAVRHQVLAVDKDQPVSNIRTMEEIVASSLWSWRQWESMALLRTRSHKGRMRLESESRLALANQEY